MEMEMVDIDMSKELEVFKQHARSVIAAHADVDIAKAISNAGPGASRIVFDSTFIRNELKKFASVQDHTSCEEQGYFCNVHVYIKNKRGFPNFEGVSLGSFKEPKEAVFSAMQHAYLWFKGEETLAKEWEVLASFCYDPYQ